MIAIGVVTITLVILSMVMSVVLIIHLLNGTALAMFVCLMKN
jgi:hypothetical protein